MTFAMEQAGDLEPKTTRPRFQATPTYGYHGQPVDPQDENAEDVVYGYDNNFNTVMTTITKILRAARLSHNPDTFLLQREDRWLSETNGSGDCWYPTLEKALKARSLEMLENGFELRNDVDKRKHPVFMRLKEMTDGFDKPRNFPGDYLGCDIARTIMETCTVSDDHISAVLNAESGRMFMYWFREHFKIIHKGFGETNYFVRVIIKLKGDQHDSQD